VGVLGIHLLPVAQAGLVGFAFTNSPAAIPPWAARSRSSHRSDSRGFPGEKGDPLVIDLALTTVVRGRIMMAMRQGREDPDGWALDRHGKPTNDPRKPSSTAACPIGGAKGAMLALMFELICAALTGSAIGPEADPSSPKRAIVPDRPAFIAIDPGALAGRRSTSSAWRRSAHDACDPRCACRARAVSRPRKARARRASTFRTSSSADREARATTG